MLPAEAPAPAEKPAVRTQGYPCPGLTAACTQGCVPFRRQEAIAVSLCYDPFCDERLLFHSWLGTQGSGHIVQISDLIPLICGKGNRLYKAIAAGGHPAVHAQGSRD